jgi:hypothetical protein
MVTENLDNIHPSSFQRMKFLPSFTGSAGSEFYLLFVLRALQMQGDNWTRPVYLDFLEATFEADVACGLWRWSPGVVSVLLAGSKHPVQHLVDLGLVEADRWKIRITPNGVWKLKCFWKEYHEGK